MNTKPSQNHYQVWPPAHCCVGCQVCRFFSHYHHRYKSMSVGLSSDVLTPHTLLCDTSYHVIGVFGLHHLMETPGHLYVTSAELRASHEVWPNGLCFCMFVLLYVCACWYYLVISWRKHFFTPNIIVYSVNQRYLLKQSMWNNGWL